MRVDNDAGSDRDALLGSEQAEKRQITLVSLAAAAILTGFKLAVGLFSGSLGLLSEAAHSGLDTVASLLTFASVRIADRPADTNHPYGHGRFENLSAIMQGLLLLATAIGIFYESVHRLFFVTVAVTSTPWAYAVMAASIAVDLWRSRLLADAGRRFHSRALEADALNFRADLFSSAVVILGLALTAYAGSSGQPKWLLKADALAALIVGGVIVAMSSRVALQALNVLLDRAPAHLSTRLTEAAGRVPGVLAAQPVRVRESGARVLADVVVTAARTASLADAHAITEQVERAIHEIEPRAETVVHVEPAPARDESAVDAVRAAALRHGVVTHHEEVYRVDDALEASVHVEFPPTATLAQAHAAAHDLAEAIIADEPSIHRVDTHIEAVASTSGHRREVSRARAEQVEALRHVIEGTGLTTRVHDIRIYEADGRAASYADVTIACGFPPGLTIGTVHERTEQLEQRIRTAFPALGRVMVHAEPDTLHA
jgi:cation diffusion facilitator family transporter